MTKVFHGENVRNSPEYRTWTSIKTRCNNPNCNDFKNYGAKGIKVCKEWSQSYLQFLKDMGRRPTKKHTIERIDNNKGYCKENCKWTTRAEQNRNRSINIIFNGETAIEASKRLGGSRNLVNQRLRGDKRYGTNKWTIEKAFTTPIAFT